MPIQTFEKTDFYSKAKNWYAPLLGTVIVDDKYFVADFLPVSGMKMVIKDISSSSSSFGGVNDIYFCTDWNSSTNEPINKIEVVTGMYKFNANYFFKNNSGNIYGYLYNATPSGIYNLGFNMLFNVGNDWYLLTAVSESPYHHLIKVSYPYETYSLIGLAVDDDYLSANGKYYMAPVYLTKANQIISTVPNIYCITKKPANTSHVVGDNYILFTPYAYNFEGLNSWLVIDLSS